MPQKNEPVMPATSTAESSTPALPDPVMPSEVKKATEKERFNPFKGPSAYQEGDKENFYGREKEINELIRVIAQNTLTMVYSKSGIGKSSLLKAGIIPVLKKINTYFPIEIRISDSLITPQNKSFSQAIISLVKSIAYENGILVESDKISEEPSLTEFIYSSNFFISSGNTAGDKKTITPVLIFDQFEEIFSLEFTKAKIMDLIDDLSYLIESRIPQNLMESYNAGTLETEEKLFFLKDRLQAPNKWYRILFSFREEYLPRFESLKKKIPSIFFTNGRFHLEAFTIGVAATVINKISKESLEIENETAAHLARMLSKTDNEITNFNEEVQPFLLSLVCNSLYFNIVGADKDSKIMQEVLNEKISLIDNIITYYAGSVFKNISIKTRNFIEDELITRDNKRTMYPLRDLKDKHVLRELSVLYTNSNQRYLNTIEFFNASYVEILHDRLLKPLISSRKKREKKEARKKIALWSSISAFAIAGLLFLYLREQDKISLYNDFFSKDAAMQLTNLKTRLKSDTLNTISPLISIMDYEESMKDVPFFSNKSWLNSTSSSTLLDSLKKKIWILYQKNLFINHGSNIKVNYSSKHLYQYDLAYNKKDTSKVTEKDTLKVTLRLLNTSLASSTNNGSLRSVIAVPLDSTNIFSSIYGKNDYNYSFTNKFSLEDPANVFFSDDDSLIGIKTPRKTFIYSLMKPGPEKILEILNPDKQSYEYIYYIFSWDNRYLINPNPDFDAISLNKTGRIYSLTRPSEPPVLYKNKAVINVFNSKDNGIQFLYIQNSNYDLSPNRYSFRDNHTQKNIVAEGYCVLNDSIIAFYGMDGFTLVNRNNVSKIYPFNKNEQQIRYVQLLDTKNEIAVIGNTGAIDYYAFKNNTLQYLRSRHQLLPEKNSRGSDIRFKNCFVSPDNKYILINYYGNLEIYDMEKDSIVNTYELYKGPLSYASFNLDNSVNLFDSYGFLVQWYFKIKSPANTSELFEAYNQFKRLGFK